MSGTWYGKDGAKSGTYGINDTNIFKLENNLTVSNEQPTSKIEERVSLSDKKIICCINKKD